jgi:hypothetical protein
VLRKEAASTTHERLLKRIDGAGQVSASKKKIFSSLHPTPNPADEEREETVRLAAKRSGDIAEAKKLWSTLCQLAADIRSAPPE